MFDLDEINTSPVFDNNKPTTIVDAQPVSCALPPVFVLPSSLLWTPVPDLNII